MPAFDEDDDRDLGGSQDGSSDNELDETMRDGDEGDADPDADGEDEVDADADADNDENDDAASQSAGSQVSDTFDPSAEQVSTGQDESRNSIDEPGSKGLPVLPGVRPEVLAASTYDIVPTIAAPQSTSINAITATADTRWVFSGGSDGYIRRYNWVDSVNAKLMLTVAQRHPFVDSVVKAGVLMSYWEHWDRSRNPNSQSTNTAATLSPVYSLAVQNQGLWLLSGTESGTIRLQSIRHDEGKDIAVLQQHSSAVSVLSLSSDEQSLLSGSWDKSVIDWDLNTGKVRTRFASTISQVSSIESRPISGVPVPAESGEQDVVNDTFSSNNAKLPGMLNGVHSRAPSQPPPEHSEPGATPDSLFGGGEGDDDLFGDSTGALMTNGDSLQDTFAEDEEAAAAAILEGPKPDGSTDVLMTEQNITDTGPVQEVGNQDASPSDSKVVDPPIIDGEPSGPSEELSGEIIEAPDLEDRAPSPQANETQEPLPTSDSTFLATSIDGTIRVWDRRQPSPIARVHPRNTPPWCWSACWSPDGNNIYAGRRNGTVEEYDLRKGLRGPERVFKFPTGSGAVTSVKAMPNGRHLICASYDILRLYDLKEPPSARSTVPFLIVPGHRTGTISHLYTDPACRFMISTGGNRGWEGSSTEVLLGYEIGVPP